MSYTSFILQYCLLSHKRRRQIWNPVPALLDDYYPCSPLNLSKLVYAYSANRCDIYQSTHWRPDTVCCIITSLISARYVHCKDFTDDDASIVRFYTDWWLPQNCTYHRAFTTPSPSPLATASVLSAQLASLCLKGRAHIDTSAVGCRHLFGTRSSL